jgi:diacylglycerol kinase (ATP)
MSITRNVFFIVNKFSGIAYEESVEGRIIDECTTWGLKATIEFTRERGHATELARTAVANGFQLIFAVGGDGTVNEVAQALVHTKASLGILPKGSGNGLARHLGIPMHFPSALELIRSNRSVKIDSVSINEHLSFNVSGIGFDGHVAMRFGRNGKRGLAGYVRTVLSEFWSFDEFGGKATIDGRNVDLKGFIIAIANASQFGNNARVAPLASVCDQQLDLSVIRKVGVLKVLQLVSRLFNGTIGESKHVTLQKASEVELILDRAVDYHIDGEPKGVDSEYKIRIVPACLNVVVPERATGKI